MPLYDYRCRGCSAEFEELRSIDERAEATCPKCGSGSDKLVSASRTHEFPAGWFEHIGPKPLHIENKKQLKAACREHGCYATGLLGD